MFKMVSGFGSESDTLGVHRSPLNSLLWLSILMLVYAGLSWSFWSYRSHLFEAGVVVFTLAVAGVHACAGAGFPVWAGLFSLTFGSLFIVVGTLISSGLFGWAVAIASIGTGIFLLDLALSQSVEILLAIGWGQTRKFWILTLVCFVGVALGWLTAVIVGT